MALQVLWTGKAREDMALIYAFYAEKSMAAADRILLEIVQTAEDIRFPEQYQQDEYNSFYRRMIVRHYKILYRVHADTVFIARVFDTRQSPRKQSE
jgi:plasmid stabilization system protein ParE